MRKSLSTTESVLYVIYVSLSMNFVHLVVLTLHTTPFFFFFSTKNVLMLFLIIPENLCYGQSLDALHRGVSSKYP